MTRVRGGRTGDAATRCNLVAFDSTLADSAPLFLGVLKELAVTNRLRQRAAYCPMPSSISHFAIGQQLA